MSSTIDGIVSFMVSPNYVRTYNKQKRWITVLAARNTKATYIRTAVDSRLRELHQILKTHPALYAIELKAQHYGYKSDNS